MCFKISGLLWLRLFRKGLNRSPSWEQEQVGITGAVQRVSRSLCLAWSHSASLPLCLWLAESQAQQMVLSCQWLPVLGSRDLITLGEKAICQIPWIGYCPLCLPPSLATSTAPKADPAHSRLRVTIRV